MTGVNKSLLKSADTGPATSYPQAALIIISSFEVRITGETI
jgi:hypothetical protein